MSLVPSFFGTESTQYVSFYCLNNSVKNHSILTVGEVHISGAKVTLKRRHDNICHQKTVNALSHQLHVTAVDGQIHDTTARSACCIRLHSNGGDASGITAIQSMGNKTHYGGAGCTDGRLSSKVEPSVRLCAHLNVTCNGRTRHACTRIRRADTWMPPEAT